MLHSLKAPGSAARDQSEDLFGLLMACHGRIRHFCALALRLCEPAPATDLAEAALAVRRYFVIALPLHVQDEDVSLSPRLGGAVSRPELVAALGRMQAEHGPIEAAVEQGAPLWQALADDPSRQARLLPDLSRCGEHLRSLLLPHLAHEEEHVFTALSLLPAHDQRAVLDEMRARRT